MSQHDYSLANASGASFRADLNNALAAIVSINSGAGSPATTYAYQLWADTTANQLKIRNAANDDWIVLRELDGTLLVEDGAVGTPAIAFTDDIDTGIFSSAANTLNIATAGVNRTTVDSNGHLLIGAHSSQTATFGTNFQISSEGPNVLCGSSYLTHTNDANGSWLVLGKSRGTTAGSTTIVQDDDHIGTIGFAPADGTDFVSTSAMIRSAVDGTPGANDTPGRLEFWTCADGAQNVSKRMSILSNGNVGINTDGPTNTQFYVNGSSGTGSAIYGQANGSGSNYGVYGYSETGNSAQYGVYGQVETSSTHSSGGVLGYSINSNTYGIVGYWSTSAYHSFYGNGDVAGTSFTNVSDSRLKDVDSNLTGCLDKLANIQPVKYTWKENSQQRRSVGEGLEIGLLAQEVQAQFPELVSDMEWPEITGANPETLNEQLGTTLGVDYGRMAAVLIQALNEAKVRIETIETKVAALEGN